MTPQIPKPEWFQLTEDDSIQPRPRINRVTRMLALSTPLLVLGMSYMVAQGSNAGVPAHSILAAAPVQTQGSNSTPATNQAAPSGSQARIASSSFTTTPSSQIAPLTKPTGGSDDDEVVSAPIGSSVAGGISVMPTGGSDDDDEGVEDDD